MTLNPVQFGTEVIDPFGRYLMTTFPIADRDMEEKSRCAFLKHGIGGERLIAKLEMVLRRNVPPTPANYAQRAGRAGRRHRIAVVFTQCPGNAHGRKTTGSYALHVEFSSDTLQIGACRLCCVTRQAVGCNDS